MNSRDLALFAAEVLNEKKAFDISIVDIAERSGFADFFVTASAASLRQMSSLADELSDKLLQQGAVIKNTEGKGASGWILIDCGDVIINIFTEEARNKYQIEKLWGDCRQIEFEEAK